MLVIIVVAAAPGMEAEPWLHARWALVNSFAHVIQVVCCEPISSGARDFGACLAVGCLVGEGRPLSGRQAVSYEPLEPMQARAVDSPSFLVSVVQQAQDLPCNPL